MGSGSDVLPKIHLRRLLKWPIPVSSPLLNWLWIPRWQWPQLLHYRHLPWFSESVVTHSWFSESYLLNWTPCTTVTALLPYPCFLKKKKAGYTDQARRDRKEASLQASNLPQPLGKAISCYNKWSLWLINCCHIIDAPVSILLLILKTTLWGKDYIKVTMALSEPF